MSKYDIKAVVCDYGIYENDELKIIVNSQANALLIKYVLEQDLQHKVVIADLLEKTSKKKRKFRAKTNLEYCITYANEENFSCLNCSLYRYSSICALADNSIAEKPYKTKDGKYIMIEAKE